jgi:hypothetical protein
MKKNYYTNPYTILEKVRKGEIKTHYRSEDGLFGRLDFYKKPDLVKPYIHYIDEIRIKEMMTEYLSGDSLKNKAYDYFNSIKQFLPAEKKVDLDKFISEVRDVYQYFPKHLNYDVFKMYYSKIEKLEFEERNYKNFTKYKLLERSNNPVGKIMSEGSHLKSAIYTRNTIGYFLFEMARLEFVDPDKARELKKSLSDAGSEAGNQNKLEEILKDMFDNSKQHYEKQMKDAQEICKNLDENVSEDIQEDIYANPDQRTNMSAGKMTTDFIAAVTAQIDNIKLSMGSLKNSLKKILDKSISYFSARKVPVYDDLFNAQDISGLEDYELLHPNLRKIFAEDVQVKDHINVGKINIYIDVSGSMGHSCGVVNEKGDTISRMDFGKSMMAKLKEMGILNQIYPFTNHVKSGGIKTDIISIATLQANGGTDLNQVVKHIEKGDKNAIIVTDAEDGCQIYSKKAFFIGVKGSSFHRFSNDVMKQYAQNEQVILFDGQKISKVNEKGYVS